MTTPINFNALAFSKKLKLVGFTDQQAEGQAEAMAELFEEKIATKEDIKRLELATKQLELATKEDFKHLELSTKADIQRLEEATKKDINALRQDIQKDFIIFKKELVITLGSLMAGIVTLLPAIFKVVSYI